VNKPAFILAAFITVIALSLIGGLIYTGRNNEAALGGQSQVVDPGAQPTAARGPALDQNLQQTLLEREAAYQKMIQQANARIQELEQQQADSQVQSQANQSQVAITPQQAAEVAANFLGQGNVLSVEGASISGLDVFKVNFSSGETVYVSLNGVVISVPMQTAPILGHENEAGDHD
jgi:hypothetical protein